MKLAVIIMACMAMVAVHAIAAKEVKLADKAFLEKEKFFLEILRHVGEPLLFDEWIKHGEKLIVDETHYTDYNDMMVNFYETYKAGGLLAQEDFFSVVNKYHINQACGLFNFFYRTKHWDTFVDNVVWARINVNQGMFVYALTLAVIHRDDMTGIMLPAIYEIFPQMFFNSKLIMQAEKFDWELWNKQIMYEKQWASIYEKKHFKNIQGKNWYMKDWKMWQWWKLMGLDEEWHKEDKCMLREDIDKLKNDSKWTALWSDMKMAWIPVDYTRDVEIFNEDTKLSYFTEDLGWNGYWYYLNMDYAKILNSNEFHLSKDRRGEWWIFNVQQMLARYHMERYSHGLGKIAEFSWHGSVREGYDPELIAYNGIPFTMRKNYWQVQTFENIELLNKIMSIDRRIDDAIASGKFTTKAGVAIDLLAPESIEVIGNMMQGNIDIIDRVFFGYWLTLSSVYLTGHKYDDMTVMPSSLANYETMMRDPLYYRLLRIVGNKLHSYGDLLTPYKHEELLFKGVTITDVQVDKMMTYFDLMDFDVTTLLNDEMVFEDGKFVWDKVLLARQMRLNHKPYELKIKVNSAIDQKALVRIFLAPYMDEYEQYINLIKNRENILEIDEFVYHMSAGDNTIIRNSKDYSWTIKDRTTYSELYKLVMMAYEGKHDLQLDILEPHCGFPSRLVLPRGWVKGMPMKLFVMISPYVEKEQPSSYDHTYLCGIGSGDRHYDEMPFGYPFDRKIERVSEFLVPNMFWKDVKIYHVDKFEKYIEHKYEHFGSFDYNF